MVQQAPSALSPDRLYELIVETSSELICLTDAEGCLVFVNQASSGVLGYTPEEMIGRHFSEFVELADAERAEDAYRETSEGRSVFRRQIRALRKHGEEVHLLFNSTPFFDDDGDFLGAVAVVTNVTENELLRRDLERLVNTDDLTGLANRRHFLNRLEHHLGHCARYGWRGAVVVLDVDRLKRVNDTLGHAAGDLLIIELAQRLRRRLRESDALARLRGDEFAVLLPEADLADAMSAARSLIETAAAEPIAVGEDVAVTASSGVALIDSNDSADAVLDRADRALYRAKSRGGNGVELIAGEGG